MLKSQFFRFVIAFIVFLSLISIRSNAQTRFYYDEFFKSLSSSKTQYFREFTQTDSGIFVQEICQDTLIARGIVSGNEITPLVNEFAHFVKSFANPYQMKNDFVPMRADIDYYKQGVRDYKFVSHSGKVFYAQYWLNGEALLHGGTGSRNYGEGDSQFFQFFKDSVMTEMFEVRKAQGDTIYYTFDKIAEPHNGYERFSKDLIKILNYPGFARLMGKEGMVYVAFIIDKTGRLAEFKPLTHEGFNLEKRAVERLAKMPDWRPSVYRGKPVKMKFTIPIRFRLY